MNRREEVKFIEFLIRNYLPRFACYHTVTEELQEASVEQMKK